MIEMTVNDGYGLEFSVTTLEHRHDDVFIVNMKMPSNHQQHCDGEFLEEMKKVIDVAIAARLKLLGKEE